LLGHASEDGKFKIIWLKLSRSHGWPAKSRLSDIYASLLGLADNWMVAGCDLGINKAVTVTSYLITMVVGLMVQRNCLLALIAAETPG
jgi:hypothetical protein